MIRFKFKKSDLNKKNWLFIFPDKIMIFNNHVINYNCSNLEKSGKF